MPKYNLPTAAATAKVAAANVVAMPIATPTFEGWIYQYGTKPMMKTFHALPGTNPDVDGAFWYEDGETEMLAGYVGSNDNGELIFVSYGCTNLTSDRPISQGGAFDHQDKYMQSVKIGLPCAIYENLWFAGIVEQYHIDAYRQVREKAGNLAWLEKRFKCQS